MFCPYVRKSFLRITNIKYNEDDIETDSAIYEQYENAECQKSQCGAWYKGRCRYNENND